MDYLNKNTNVPPPNRITAAGIGLRDSDCPVNERKQSSTEMAIGSIEKVHARLEALVSELERRLMPILFPTAPQDPQAGQSQAASCPLAGKMFSEAEVANAVAERIDSIISRIDV